MPGVRRPAVAAAARPARSAARLDLRLVPVAVAAWVAAGVLVGAPGEAAVVAALAWVLAAIALLLARRVALAALVAVALAAVGLVAVVVWVRHPVRSPPGLDGQSGAVELVVGEDAPAGATAVRGVADVVGEVTGEIPVLVVGLDLREPLRIGMRVGLEGRAAAYPEGRSNQAMIVAASDPVLLEPAPWWLAWAGSAREGFRAVAAALPGDGGALLTGLAIGDDALVPADLEEAMRTTSLSHLTAVSGANCAVVVAGVMAAGRLAGLRRRTRIAVALPALAGFVILVTPQPSVVRAAVMASAALVGLALARPMRGLPLLSLAVVLILVVDPWSSREFGFVLSASATAGLLVLARPLAALLAAIMPYRLAEALGIPIAAQVACQPALALLADGLPTYGVVANLLAVPAAPAATVLGLAACLMAGVAPPLADAAAWAAWAPSAWIAGTARYFADLPLATLPWPGGPPGLLLDALLAGLLASAALARRGPRRAGALLGIAVVAACWSGWVATRGVVGALDRPADWSLAMCDVGQGDAVVVRDGPVAALIDTGPAPEPLAACLDELGIDRLDLLVLTHFDADHAGGVEAVVGRVDRALVGPADERARDRYLDPLAAGGAAVGTARRGDAGALGGLAWQVLWPPAHSTATGNDASVVVRVSDADGRGLLLALGDLGEGAQQALQRAGPVGEALVVKVSHHGSADQSAALYRRVGAAVALVGVGADNDYGHPTERALDLLGDAAVGRTDRHGMLLVAVRGAAVELWRQRAG